MRIAFCLSGQIRDFALTRRSLEKHIIAPLDHHQICIFAHFPTEDLSHLNLSGLPFTGISVEDESHHECPTFPQLDHQVAGRPWHHGSSLRAYYFQLRSVYLANSLRCKFEEEHSFLFDWVFRLRFDNLYFGSRIEDLSRCKPECIYLPGHDNWGGYNDRFAFGGSQLMNTYSSRFLAFSQLAMLPEGFHPERLLKYFLDSRCVPVERSRVSHHLLRYRSLWRASFIPEQGDTLPPQPSLLSSLDARLSTTRIHRLVDALHIFKVMVAG